MIERFLKPTSKQLMLKYKTESVNGTKEVSLVMTSVLKPK